MKWLKQKHFLLNFSLDQSKHSQYAWKHSKLCPCSNYFPLKHLFINGSQRMISFRTGNKRLKWISEISHPEYSEWIMERFFTKKNFFILSQHSEAIFHYNINKRAKPEANHIKILPNGSTVPSTFINKILFSYSCTEQRMFGLISFKQVFKTDH